MTSNETRAERGQTAITLYVQAGNGDQDCDRDSAIDLIADILHTIGSDGMTDARSITQSALMHFEAEIDEANNDDGQTDDHRCDQCVAAMINGVYCHETGCPNS